MENDIKIFNYEDKEIRILDIDGEPWWVAKDVCDVLELGNITEALRGLDEDELSSVSLKSGGQAREMSIISDPGLYSLILRSRKPEAKVFKRWITHDVLPAIRKTGMYQNPVFQEAIMQTPEIELDYKTARYALDGVTAFRDVMTIAMKKRIMRRYYKLIGVSSEIEADGGDEDCFSDDFISQIECFINECCVIDPLAQCSRNDFYECFSRWCLAHGLDVPSRTKVIRSINRMGRLDCGINAKCRFFEGVRCV